LLIRPDSTNNQTIQQSNNLYEENIPHCRYARYHGTSFDGRRLFKIIFSNRGKAGTGAELAKGAICSTPYIRAACSSGKGSTPHARDSDGNKIRAWAIGHWA
jgi:hypothetical protein